ncbi:MAG: carbohydrate kinase, partial [Myxococcales bacterium]|nr:carbohydrate kinase [Myxococcales bacterium]
MTPDILVFGEALVDFVPTRRGRLRNVSGFELHSGGAPGNVAIGCARLGARAGLVSVVGDDEFGHFLRHAFQTEGVDVQQLRHAAGQRTGLCFITLDADGERRFTHRGGAPETLLNVGDV